MAMPSYEELMGKTTTTNTSTKSNTEDEKKSSSSMPSFEDLISGNYTQTEPKAEPTPKTDPLLHFNTQESSNRVAPVTTGIDSDRTESVAPVTPVVPTKQKTMDEQRALVEEASKKWASAQRTLEDALATGGDVASANKAVFEAKAELDAEQKALDTLRYESRLTKDERESAKSIVDEITQKSDDEITEEDVNAYNDAYAKLSNDSATKLGRYGNAIGGAAVGYGGDIANSVGTTVDVAKFLNVEEVEPERQAYNLANAKMQSLYENPTATEDDILAAEKATQEAYDVLYAKASEVAQGKENAVTRYGDTLADKSSDMLSFAKQNATGLESLGVDIAQNVTQMGIDTAIGAATGFVGSGIGAAVGGERGLAIASKALKARQAVSTAMMGLRSYGGGAREAREDGADVMQQATYGAASAAVELATEKMFDGVAGIYGKGAADEIVDAFISNVAKGGKAKTVLLHSISGALGEGLEETVSAAVNPFIKAIYDDGKGIQHTYTTKEGWKELGSEVLNSFLVAGTIGFVGGGIGAIKDGKWKETPQGKKLIEDAKAEGVSEAELQSALDEAVDSQQKFSEAETETASDIAQDVTSPGRDYSIEYENPSERVMELLIKGNGKVATADAQEIYHNEQLRAEYEKLYGKLPDSKRKAINEIIRSDVGATTNSTSSTGVNAVEEATKTADADNKASTNESVPTAQETASTNDSDALNKDSKATSSFTEIVRAREANMKDSNKFFQWLADQSDSDLDTAMNELEDGTAKSYIANILDDRTAGRQPLRSETNEHPVYEKKLTPQEEKLADALRKTYSMSDAEVGELLEDDGFRKAFEERSGKKLEGKQSDQIKTVKDYAQNEFLSKGGFTGENELAKQKQDAEVSSTESELQYKIDQLTEQIKAAEMQGRFDKVKALAKQKVKYEESLKRQTAQTEKARAKTEELKQRFRDYKDKKARDSAISKIQKVARDMRSKLNNPTETNHIPSELKNTVIDLLEFIDNDATRLLDEQANASEGSTATDLRISAEDTFASIKEKYSQFKGDADNYVYYDDYTHQILDDISESVGSTPFSQMTPKELKQVLNGVKAINKACKDAVTYKVGKETHDRFHFMQGMEAELKEHKGKAEIPDELKQTTRGGVVGNLKNISTHFQLSLLRAENVFLEFGNWKENSKWATAFKGLNDGQKKASSIKQAAASYFTDLTSNKESIRELGKTITLDSLRTPDGQKIKLNNNMLYSLYMHLQNEDNIRHILRGGLEIPNIYNYTHGNNNNGFGNTAVRTYSDALEVGQARSEFKEAREAYNQAAKELAKGLEDSNITTEQLNKLKLDMDAAEAKLDSVIPEEEVARLNAIKDEVESLVKSSKFGTQYIEAAQNMFKHLENEINATTEDVYGFTRDMLQNYFPISTDANMRGTSLEDTVREINSENWGNLKKRVSMATQPIRLYALTDVCGQYANKASTYCGIMPATRNFSKMWGMVDNSVKGKTSEDIVGHNGESLRSIITEKYGDKGTQYINDAIIAMQGGGRVTPSVFDKLTGNLAGSSLKANPSVAIGQLGSLYAAASVIDMKYLNKSYFANMTSEQRAVRNATIDKYSALLFERGNGNGISLDDKTTSQRLDNKMSAITGWISGMDRYTVGLIWDACEMQVKDAHKSDANCKVGTDSYYNEVAKLWENALEHTQPMYSTLQRADIARNNNAIVRSLAMYSTVRLQNWNTLYKASSTLSARLSEYKANGTVEAKTELDKAAKQFARDTGSVIASNLFYAFLKTGTKLLTRNLDKFKDDKDEFSWEEVGKAAAWTAAEAIAGCLPAMDIVVAAIESQMTGSKFYDNFSVPSVDALNKLVSNTINFAKYVMSKDEGASGKAVKSLYAAVSTFLSAKTGMPVSGIESITESIMNVAFDMKDFCDKLNGDETIRMHEADVDISRILVDVANGEFNIDTTPYVQRNNSQNGDIIIDSFLGGDTDKADQFAAEIDAIEAVTVNGTSSESVVKSRVTDRYTDAKDPMSREDAMKVLTEYGGMSEEDAEAKLKELDFRIEHRTGKKLGTSIDDLKEAFLKTGKLSDGTEITPELLEDWYVEYGGMGKEDAENSVAYFSFIKENANSEILSEVSKSDFLSYSNGDISLFDLRQVTLIKSLVKEANINSDEKRDYDAIDALLGGTIYASSSNDAKDAVDSSYPNLDKLYSARRAGIKSEQYYELKAKFDEICKNDGTASDHNIAWETYLQNEKLKGNLNSVQVNSMKKLLKDYAQIAGDTQTFNKLISNNLTPDEAQHLSTMSKGLEEKDICYAVTSDSSLSEADKYNAIMVYTAGSKQRFGMYTVFYNAGIPLSKASEFSQALDSVLAKKKEEKGNSNIDGESLAKAIRQMGFSEELSHAIWINYGRSEKQFNKYF